MVDHVVGESHLALRVSDDRELELSVADVVDILDPRLVGSGVVSTQTNKLDVTLGELGLELGEGAQLGGADRGEVVRVREDDAPAVAEVLVEADGAIRSFGLEVRSSGAEAQSRLRHVCNYRLR